jgi:hypothetical protein
VRTGGVHEVDDVRDDGGVHVDASNGLLGACDVRQVCHRCQLVQGMAAQLALGQLHLVRPIEISQFDVRLEPVQLGLWKRERAYVYARVPGRQNHVRVRHRVGDAVHSHLLLFQALKERRLGPRRGPVDFVYEDQVGHDGTRVEMEIVVSLIEDVRSRDVGGEQV